jgi:hypothetical protein
MNPRPVVLALSLLLTFSAFSETYERLLLPLVITDLTVPGAFGSQWTTELTIQNASDETVLIDPVSCTLLVSPCPPFGLAPHEVWRFGLKTLASEPVAFGTGDRTNFVYVPAAAAGNIHFGLVAKDVSRLAQTFGTELPVVRASEFRTTTMSLLNVPVQPPFRSRLRMYQAALTPVSVRVRVFDLRASTAITDRIVELSAAARIVHDHPLVPGYAELGEILDDAVRLGLDTVRVEIDPVNEPVWAFISVTNNETQQVTLVTPQRAR